MDTVMHGSKWNLSDQWLGGAVCLRKLMGKSMGWKEKVGNSCSIFDVETNKINPI